MTSDNIMGNHHVSGEDQGVLKDILDTSGGPLECLARVKCILEILDKSLIDEMESVDCPASVRKKVNAFIDESRNLLEQVAVVLHHHCR